MADDFEAGLAADRAAAEARLAELAEFEASAAADANSSLFFKGLYKCDTACAMRATYTLMC